VSVGVGGHYLVLGAGGLGCPALLGLVAAGADAITIVDHDVVDASNLQRQVLYTTGDVGMAKVEAAAVRLRSRAPRLRISPLRLRLDHDNLDALLAAQPAGTVVLECSDAPGLKFLVNDTCLSRQLPLVIAGVQRWRGQVQAVVRGHACLRCMFEEAPPPEQQESCAMVGVIGAAAGLLGYWMAHLAVALHAGAAVAGELWAIDTRSLAPQMLRPLPRAGCPACAAAHGPPHAPPRAVTGPLAACAAP
jgi:molybdopterin/thiamine biosynthesis adenylyltransferase